MTCGNQATPPNPGEPSGTVYLSAVAAYGGIELSWNYPDVNPHAVSHVQVWRSASNLLNEAILINTVAGSYYFDRQNNSNTYYYWIRIISYYGTALAFVGPASAQARPLLTDLIQELTGQIDAGVLATSLQTEITRIGTNATDIYNEVADRTGADALIEGTLTTISGNVATALTLIDTETTNRISGQEAIAQQIDELIAVSPGGAYAAIEEIQTTKIGYSALASDSTTPYDGDGVTDVYPVGTYPTIDYPDYAVNRKRIIDKVGVTEWNLTAAGIAKPLVWIVGMPLASSIKTVEVAGPEGGYAALEQAFTAQGTLNNGFKALYTAKVDVNGLVGGFGIYNDGVVVEAGFDVDKFWVGRSGPDKIKPFIINNDTVYINNAVIANLTADHITTGLLAADNVLTRGMTVRDNAGNIILSAGTPLASSNITPAAGWLNSNITLTGNAGTVTLNNAGGGSFTIGTLGYTGALNATANALNFGVYASIPAGSNGDFYFATDKGILYQKIGGSWQSTSTSNNITSGLDVNRPTGNDGDIYYATDALTLYQKINGSWVSGPTAGAPTGSFVAGTLAQTVVSNAATSLSLLNDIASDSKLTPVEKQDIRREWDTVAAEKTGIDGQATTFGITTEKTNYGTAFQTLANYLNAGSTWVSGIPSWISDANLTVTTDITGTTFRTNWKDLYDKRQILLNKISDVAGTRAAYENLTGTPAASILNSNVTPETLGVVKTDLTNAPAGVIPNHAFQAGTSTGWTNIASVGADVTASGGYRGTVNTNDNLTHPRPVPVDPLRVYQLRVRLWATSPGAGTFDVGVACFQGDGTTEITGSSMLRVNAAVSAETMTAGQWVTYEAIVTGTQATASGTDRNKFFTGTLNAAPYVKGSSFTGSLYVDFAELVDVTAQQATAPALKTQGTSLAVGPGYVAKTANTGDAAVRSVAGYVGGAYVAFVPRTDNKQFTIGLNTDPDLNAAESSIDYGIRCTTSGTLVCVESGATQTPAPNDYAVGDVLEIDYDGTNVIYYKNGVQIRSVAATITNPLYLDSNFLTQGGLVGGLQFGPLTNAANGNVAYTGTANYRLTGAPTNAPTPTGVTITTNANATINIRLDWGAYTQGARQADLLFLVWCKGNSAPTINDSALAFNVNTAAASYYIFEGVNPADTYSAGIVAARRTDSGLEFGTVQSPTSAPNWRNLGGTTPDYTGNLNGTATSTVVTNASNGNAANTAINDGTTGLSARLRNNAQNILSGGAGVSVGSLAWNASTGAYVSGNGIGINSTGIVGYKSNSPSFTIDTDGNAFFAGELSAVTGTFGTLEVATGGYIRSGMTTPTAGTGFWLGIESGTPKFSVGSSTGAYIHWNGTQLMINNGTVSGQLAQPSMTVSLNPSYFSGTPTADTDVEYFTTTATASGGQAPYTYAWTLEQGTTPDYGSTRISATTSDTCTVRGKQPNHTEKDALLTVIATDANGRVARQTLSIDTIVGTPP